MAKYAVVENGGRQYMLFEDKTEDVEKLLLDKGAVVEFDKVLLISDNGEIKAGNPYVSGAKVTGEVVLQDRAKKIRVFKYKKRKNYRKLIGHRQSFTRVLVKKIEG